jgi:non-heme chloroperoxidase
MRRVRSKGFSPLDALKRALPTCSCSHLVPSMPKPAIINGCREKFHYALLHDLAAAKGTAMSTTRTNDIMAYCEMHGEGRPLVFIHGAGASHDMWRPQVEHFSGKYKVITYDVRGHGQSEAVDSIGFATRRYSCELFADDLHALLDGLDTACPERSRRDKPVICGLSLGGMIAQAYAVRYPDDLRALVLADTAASSALGWGNKLQKALFPKWAVKPLIRCLSRERYAQFACSFFKDIEPEVKEYLIREHLKFKKEELLKLTDAIYDFQLLELSRIKVPTLIVVGERERKAVLAHAEKIHQLIEDSSIVIVRDAMHASNLENPEQSNKELEEFFSAHNRM